MRNYKKSTAVTEYSFFDLFQRLKENPQWNFIV
nr:MAG TPA: hypothetical protein [Bacteriophage sp.]